MGVRLLLSSFVLLVLAGPPPRAAQEPSTVAIVGARLVDGSGNDPFIGTIVIDGGRIRTVGRSVDPPPGARVIDGAGRTVMPGLVDVRTPAPSGEIDVPRLQRSLAAILLDGVTTVAMVLPPAVLDTMRAAIREGTTPRVLASADASDGDAWTQDAAAVRRVLGGLAVLHLKPAGSPASLESLAAEAKQRGVRLGYASSGGGYERAPVLGVSLITDVGDAAALAATAPALAQQNVTVAPDASGKRPALPEVVSALRSARVRLAVAGIGGANGGDGGIRNLVSAGLSPLEAITAATSGGAWALGLQSDRGFLAPGMRADLLVVQGDPTATIADLARIERVFLGGQEVDRAALRAILTPPPPRAPATMDAAVVAAAFRAARKGLPSRLLRPTPARGGTAPARSDNSPRRSPTVSRAGTNVPPAADTGAAADVPETGKAASASAATVTPPPVAPPSAAPPTAARPAAAPAAAAPPAGAPLPDPLLDDFERGDERSVAGSRWTSESEAPEGGVQSTVILMGRVTRGLRDRALLLTARMGEASAPFARVSLPLAPDGGPVDVSRFRGLRFEARGEGRYRVVFVTRRVSDGRYHESYFSGSPLWTPVSLPFASTGQNGAGPRVAWTGRDLVEIRFELTREAGRLGWLELDNVRLY